MARPLGNGLASGITKESILERNLINVKNVARPLSTPQASIDIRIYILWRNHTTVMCAIKLLPIAHTFGVMRDII